MSDAAYYTLLAVLRWLHIVASTLIVGGTLFFEFVVPRAIEHLKMENQMEIYAHLRLVFRRIIFGCAVLLPISGAASLYQLWPGYQRPGMDQFSAAWYWSLAHMAGGMIVVVIALALVSGNKVPERTHGWLKVNFVLMLTIIFIGSASRHVRLVARDQHIRAGNAVQSTLPPAK